MNVKLCLIHLALVMVPALASADCYAPGHAAVAAANWVEAIAAFDTAAANAGCAASAGFLAFNAAISALRHAESGDDPSRFCAAAERLAAVLERDGLDPDVDSAAQQAHSRATDRCPSQPPRASDSASPGIYAPASPGIEAPSAALTVVGVAAYDVSSPTSASTSAGSAPKLAAVADPVTDRTRAWILTAGAVTAGVGAGICWGLSHASHRERRTARAAWMTADDAAAPGAEQRFADANTRTFAFGLSSYLLAGAGGGLAIAAVWHWMDDDNITAAAGPTGVSLQGRW